MPEEKRANPFPHPTLEEVMAAPGTREEKAARFVATRHFVGGIPSRAFLLGDNDHSSMMQGVRDLTTAVFTLLDALDANDETAYRTAYITLKAMLETPVMHQPLKAE
jgi:hypothetical protein